MLANVSLPAPDFHSGQASSDGAAVKKQLTGMAVGPRQLIWSGLPLSDYLLHVSTRDLVEFQELYDRSLSALPCVQRLMSTLVMKDVVMPRAWQSNAQ